MSSLIHLVRLWALLGGAILLLIVAITTVNAGALTLDVALRTSGIRIPAIPGYEDFVRLAIAPALMMLFPYCQLHRGHLTTDFFTASLAAVIRQRFDKFWRYITALLATFLGFSMTQGMIETYNDNALSQILSWPQWPFYLPAIISVFLWAAVAFLDKDDN